MEANTSNPTAPLTSENRVRKTSTVGNLTVSRVYEAKYQKEGTLTAELKQTVETESFYPSKSVTSNMQDNPFSTEEFGFTEQEFKSSDTRVAWIDVPMTLDTPEKVAAKLASIPGAGLYKVLANHPILSDNQISAIDRGQTTKDIIGDSQVIRYPEGAKDGQGNLIEGKLILVNGKPQYRSVYYKNLGAVDQDRRTAEPTDFYATPTVRKDMGIANPQTAVAENDQVVL